jgi:drug/metabolite transporter (DMT)-like permease
VSAIPERPDAPPAALVGTVGPAKLAMGALVAYCVATAVSATWVSFSFTGVSGPALTFVTFALAQCAYLAGGRASLRAAYRFVVERPKDTLVLNALTLGAWLFMFMALQRIEASVESAVYQGAVAIVGFLLAVLLSGERYSAATRTGVLAAVVSLGLLVVTRLSTTMPTPLGNTAATKGLGLALVAGSLGGIYIHRSSTVHASAGLSALAVLCLRFWLLLVVTGIFGGREVVEIFRTDVGVAVRLVGLSIAFVIMPTFLLQYAIVHLPSVRVSVMTPLVPVIALGSEYAVRPWGSLAAPLLVIAASLALIFTNATLSRDWRVATTLTSRKEEHNAGNRAGNDAGRDR